MCHMIYEHIYTAARTDFFLNNDIYTSVHTKMCIFKCIYNSFICRRDLSFRTQFYLFVWHSAFMFVKWLHRYDKNCIRDSLYLCDITYSYVFVHTCVMTDQYYSICVWLSIFIRPCRHGENFICDSVGEPLTDIVIYLIVQYICVHIYVYIYQCIHRINSNNMSCIRNSVLVEPLVDMVTSIIVMHTCIYICVYTYMYVHTHNRYYMSGIRDSVFVELLVDNIEYSIFTYICIYIYVHAHIHTYT